MGKGKWYQQVVLEQVAYMEKNRPLDPCLVPCTKISSKCVTNLNIKAKTLKLLEENIGDYINKLGAGKGFLDRAQKAISIKEKN